MMHELPCEPLWKQYSSLYITLDRVQEQLPYIRQDLETATRSGKIQKNSFDKTQKRYGASYMKRGPYSISLL